MQDIIESYALAALLVSSFVILEDESMSLREHISAQVNKQLPAKV
jgi:hypothetical protein